LKPFIKNPWLFWSFFDLPARNARIDGLQKLSEDPAFWKDNERAQKVMRELSELREEVTDWEKYSRAIEDALELAGMEDESLFVDLEQEVNRLEGELEQRELTVLLSSRFDSGSAILAIHAGAGGTDSQDWAAMLERMYLRWIDRQGYEAEIIDTTEGEEAGIKSATIVVSGKYAYGYLKAEKGVHRLVRLSPFDAAHRRHTSFALVEVLPEVGNDDELEISPDDLRIDIFRSSGAGGQNVQKNATAIRITHLPTGIVVTCQNERSQIQNRANAMRVLKARLMDMRQLELDKQMDDIRGDYVKAEWGSQIRSYVLHPYQMVKDHRTDYETGNVQAVLDGDLNAFIAAYLQSAK
jgi:peptide chain release factor 2